MKFRLSFYTLLLILIAGCNEISPKSRNSDFVIGVWGGEESKLIEELVVEYSKATGVEIEIDVVSQDAYHDYLTAQILSKSPVWDIALAKSEWTGPWMDYHGLKAFENIVTQDNGEAGEDEHYSLPITRDIPILWYRKDILSQEHFAPPQTWEELYNTAKAISMSSDYYGIALASDQYSMGNDYLHLFLGFGGNVSLDRNEFLFNSAEGISALEFYTRLSKEGLMPPLQDDGSDPVRLLQEDQAVMAILWTSQAAVLFDCEKSPAICADGQPLIEGAKMPSGDLPSASHYFRRSTVFIMPEGSGSSLEAGAFLKWLRSSEGKRILREINPTGYFSSRFLDQYYADGINLSEFRFTDPFMDQLNGTIYETVSGQIPVSDGIKRLTDIMNEEMNRTDLRP